ncbi:MAG: hypothetical protein C4576_17510, partial [Desulfobacteraceae bacterium]
MRDKITWLHISDIHFYPKTEWRDSIARDSLIEFLKNEFNQNDSLRPDFIFCTGDIAYGETGFSPIIEQYAQAKDFFEKLLNVCGRGGLPFPRERLFVVPGNHDVNRENVNSDAQRTLNEWARDSLVHAPMIEQRFNDRTFEFRDAAKRLTQYAQFVKEYFSHQFDPSDRHRFASVVNVDGMHVGIAGFNSSWTCAGPEDERSIWLAAQCQFNMAKNEIGNAEVRIGLIHHPIDWLCHADSDIASRRISTDFHFWLHGHSHSAWVDPGQSHITIAAGAVGAQSSDEFGVNIVQIYPLLGNGTVHLYQHKAGGSGWTIAPIEVHAPHGQWPFKLPTGLCKSHETPSVIQSSGAPPKRTIKLYGREKLLSDAVAKLSHKPILMIYGMRGNGKSSLIEALGEKSPLVGKDSARVVVSPSTTPDDLFRQVAALLGETSEFPTAPRGNTAQITQELQRRYPKPRPAWIWIDHAHHLLGSNGFCRNEMRDLLLGFAFAFGMQWHLLLELRERPQQGLFGQATSECEVLGLDKNSLRECLADAAPKGRESQWLCSAGQLKHIYQWLGGGHGAQAHPLAIQLLIEVARGRDETPMDVLNRHRGELTDKVEIKLLRDLYNNVLSSVEQRLIKALALYRTSIPHDHADQLEARLNVAGAWDGLDRRCLLFATADHSNFYLHSFIAAWLRTRQLGYSGYGEDDEADFAETTAETVRECARELHSAVANSWLNQLVGSRRLTNLNITRALEAFHHLSAAGEVDRVQEIAVELLTGNHEWACRRIERLYDFLYKSGAPVQKQRRALEYFAVLDPESHKVQRFLGECFQKEQGLGSKKALICFKKACDLRPDFPPYWANLGKALLSRGNEGAREFLSGLESVERNCPQAIDDHVHAIKCRCFEVSGHPEKAKALRMEKINAGSGNAAFYADEARARLNAGDSAGAMEILDKAERNGCANEYTTSIRASVLQQIDPEKAKALRMEKINAGSGNAAFYNDEARARLNAGDSAGAMEILDKAERNGCADDYTAAIRASVLQQIDP